MRRPPAVLIAILVLALAACAPAGTGPGDGTAAGAGTITATDAWIRTGPRGGLTAAYLEVTNGESAAVTLVGVASEAAAAASLHETTTDEQGMMGMRRTDAIPIGPGETVSFRPGGLHVMLEGLVVDLVPGDTVRLVLRFDRGEPLDVAADVRAG